MTWCNVNAAHPSGWLVTVHSVVSGVGFCCGSSSRLPCAGVIHWLIVRRTASSRATRRTPEVGEVDVSAACHEVGSRLLSARVHRTLSPSEMLTMNCGGLLRCDNAVHFGTAKDDCAMDRLFQSHSDFDGTLAPQTGSVTICTVAGF